MCVALIGGVDRLELPVIDRIPRFGFRMSIPGQDGHKETLWRTTANKRSRSPTGPRARMKKATLAP